VPDWMWQLILGIQGPTISERIWPQLILGILGLAVALALLSWGLQRLRRSLKDSPDFQRSQGWTLEQVKRLYESGQLTDKQYKRLREEVAKGLVKQGRGGRSCR